jgi:hypothetical protein
MAARLTYLERYLSGEFEQVWAELEALGEAVRDEPLYSDALAVARETMRRVRQNLEMLIPRLVAGGYQFGYGWIQPPADEPFGWQLRQEYQRLLGDARTQPSIFTFDADLEDQLADRRERLQRLRDLATPAIILANEERVIAELEAQPTAAGLLRALEDHVGFLPLSVRAWHEVAGGVNLVGVHPGWVQLIAETGPIDPIRESIWARGVVVAEGGHPMQYLEPLHILPLGRPEPSTTTVFGMFMVKIVEPVMNRLVELRHRLDLMQNAPWAYLEQGQDCYPYEIHVPCTGADAPLLGERHETTFVNYLRTCLRWAGFPGWERMPVRPERDITTLTAGLLPF